MKKSLVSFAAVAGFAVTGCAVPTPTTWEAIENRGYVIVGLDDTFAPMGFRDSNNEIVGFDVDLAKLVFDTLDIDVRFQPIEWGAKVLELDAGNIDMIWNGLTITEPRRLEMLFSDPYINNRQVVLTRFNDTIDTLAELTSVKIGVQSTSASETIVEENVTFTGTGELLKYDTFNEALIDLKNGLISAVVMDEIAGRYAISQQPNQFRVMSEDFGGEQYGIGFRLANDTIRDTINDTLFDLIESGEATAISETWFSEDVLIRR
jgi:polar amino acid transport system substrate-binding protein